MPIKPEEQAELLKFIGIDPETTETIDAAKDLFGNDFIRKSEAIKDETIVSKVVGARMGSLQTETIRNFKELGIEFEADEIKSKKVEDIIKIGSAKVKSRFEEIKTQNGGGDEAVKAWEKKYESLNKKHTETTGLVDSLKKQFEDLDLSVKTEKRNSKITDYKKEAIKEIKLRSDIDQLTLVGFNTHLNSKYKIELDEEEKPYVVDLTTNARVPSKKKGASFADFGEIFELEAAANKLIAVSPHEGKPAPAKPTAGANPPTAPTTPSIVSERARMMSGKF
jgi:hypothetical protein